MPKYEDIINQNRNVNLQGLKHQGIIKCPHCNADIEMIINIPNVPMAILVKLPDSNKLSHPTYINRTEGPLRKGGLV